MAMKNYKKFTNPAGDIVYSLKDEFRKKGRVTPIALTIKKAYTFDNKKFPAYYSVTYYINSCHPFSNINRKMQNKEFKSKKELMDFVEKLTKRGK